MKAMFLFWIGLLVVLAPTAAKADSCPKTLAELAQSGKACDLPAAGIPVTKQDVELRVADAPPTTVLNAASTGKRAFYLTAANKVLRLELYANKVAQIESHPADLCTSAIVTAIPTGKDEAYCLLAQPIELPADVTGKQNGKDVKHLRIGTWSKDYADTVTAGATKIDRIFTNEAGTQAVLQLTKGDQAPPDEPAAARGPVAPQTPAVAACTSDDFTLPEGDELKKKCEENNLLCVTPGGQVIHRPALEEGNDVRVVLLQPEFRDHSFELEVTFKRTVLFDLKLLDDKRDGATWAFGPEHSVRLKSAGTLHIKTRVRPVGQAGATTALAVERGRSCVVSEVFERTLQFDVDGHYHFMLGVMPLYAGLFDRKHTLNRSDDGVQRVYAQDIREVDWALTLSGYPWGVSPDDFGAMGLVIATSVQDIGDRWYAGLEWASPIGLGLAAGAALIVVPELDNDFLDGQPLTDTQVPVHNSTEVTWFVGVNIEAQLFRKAFKALAGDDE